MSVRPGPPFCETWMSAMGVTPVAGQPPASSRHSRLACERASVRASREGAARASSTRTERPAGHEARRERRAHRPGPHDRDVDAVHRPRARGR